MPSSQSSNRSQDEEAHYTAEEDRHAHAQGETSLTGTTTPSGSSDSVYASANQTSTTSPNRDRATALSIHIAAREQDPIKALRRNEESLEECRERVPSNVTTAPRRSPFNHTAEARTYLEKQRALFMQQAGMGERQTEDAPSIGEGSDISSRLQPLQPAPPVTDGPPPSPADPVHEECREASEISYIYRPTSIDDDSQQQTFLPSSLPSSLSFDTTTTTTTPLVPNHTTDTHQDLSPIEEDEMPYVLTRKFIMNPEAPVFVPGQAPSPATGARNQREWVYYGAPQQTPDQTPESPTNTPNTAAPLPKVQLFGAAHGMSFDPNTRLFTGDGAPRRSAYRADGTLPSAPDLESDPLTDERYSEPAEDQLHILPRREYIKRMANFGKNGPVQTFRVPRPVPRGNQQGTRVMVENRGGRSALGRPVWTKEEMEGEMYVPGRKELEGLIAGHRKRVGGEAEMVNGRSIYQAEDIGAALSRLMSGVGKGEKGKESGVGEGQMEEGGKGFGGPLI